MESWSVASPSLLEIEELERFIDSYVLEYRVEGLLRDTDGEKAQTPTSQWTEDGAGETDGWGSQEKGAESSKPNGHQEASFDILGTDIWAANTLDSLGGATWDVHPEKLDLTQLQEKPRVGTPRQHLLVDPEGALKCTPRDTDGVIQRHLQEILPEVAVCHAPRNEAEITHTKKLLRRRRSDRRKPQRPQPPEVKSQNPQVSLQQSAAQWPGSGKPAGEPKSQTNHSCSRSGRWPQNQIHPGAAVSLPGGVGEGAVIRTRKPDQAESGEANEPAPPRSHPEPERAPGHAPPTGRDCRNSQPHCRKEAVSALTSLHQRSCVNQLTEILSNMGRDGSEVDRQLMALVEEARSTANSEEVLSEVVGAIYCKAVGDRSLASGAAKLCQRMALSVAEGTKFRSLLLNRLQKDFTRREELRRLDPERWLGLVTFLCEVFGTMRSSTGEPFRVLVCPIYTCLRELLESSEIKEDAVLCCSMELQTAGPLLEEQFPEMMTELLAAARDKMLRPSESALTRSLLMEVIELHAHRWRPLEELTRQYYNSTIRKLTA